MSIFCFSLKVLSQGSSGENPQSPALIDSTELAHLSIATTPWMGCYFLFPSRVTASYFHVFHVAVYQRIVGNKAFFTHILEEDKINISLVGFYIFQTSFQQRKTSFAPLIGQNLFSYENLRHGF